MVWIAKVASIYGLVLSTILFARKSCKYLRRGRVLKQLEAACLISEVTMLEIARDFAHQMSVGLSSSNPSTSLPMLPSYAVTIPNGTERGTYYALDLGGTNFRMMQVTLEPNTAPRVVSREVQIEAKWMKCTAEELFGYIADQLATFVRSMHEGEEAVKCDSSHSDSLGFCFSFPMEQVALDSGILLCWTKGYGNTTGVGADVVQLFTSELKKRSLDMKIGALLNDTVGTLAVGCYNNPDTTIAIILGTGTNAAYMEDITSITKMEPNSVPKNAKRMIINMEWGQFTSECIPRMAEDFLLDRESTHPGEYLFEKMISGMWLGDVVRRVLVRLAKTARIFGGFVPNEMHLSLSTPDMSLMDQDESQGLQQCKRIMEDVLLLPESVCTLHNRRLAQRVCELVRERAARLLAAAVKGVILKMRRGSGDEDRKAEIIRVAIDGGLYENYKAFGSSVDKSLKSIMSNTTVEFQLTRDGSGIGAAFLVAAVSTHNSRS